MAAAQYYDEVQQAYLAFYGRPADPAGLAYWATQLSNAGGNLNSIINAFGTSAESTALYGGSNTAAQITAIYQTLFGRAPDAAGLNFYENGIATGQFTLASVALNIYYGAQGSDATALAAKLVYADAFTNALEASPSAQVAYSGTAASNNARAAVATVVDTTSEQTAAANLSTTVANIGTGSVGQTYTLTTGVDNITLTGNNNVVNGLLGAVNVVTGVNPSTLSPLDTITGTGTGNTLNISDLSGGTALPAGISISGVQTVNLTSVGVGSSAVAGALGDNFTGFTGLTTLNVKEIGGTVVSGGTTGITAAGTTAVNVTDAAQGTGNINVYGGSNVAVTAAGVAPTAGSTTSVATTVGAITVGSTTAAPTGTITITATDAAVTETSTNGVVTTTVGGQITTTGGTTVSVTQNITAPVVTGTTGTTGTDVGGAVVVNGTATTTSVTVNQTAAVAAVAGAAAQVIAPPIAQVNTVTITGPIVIGETFTVNVNGTPYAFNATAATASNVADGLAALLVGAGVNVGHTGGTATLTLTAPIAGTVFASSATTNSAGGAIGDSTTTPNFVGTIATPAIAPVGGIADGAVTVQDVNFGSTTKAGTITNVSLNNFNSGATANTINDTGLTNLTLAGTGGAVNINEAGSLAAQAVTTLNLTANAVTGATAAVTDAGIKTLNVVTGGAAASTLAFNDAALTTINVSGTQNITLTPSSTSVAAVNVSGGAGVTIGIGASTVFAATGTGNDVVTLNGALTKTSGGSITFGSGNNSLLAGTGASIAAGVAVDGGVGGTNTISASLVNAGNAATIKDFQILDVSGFGSGAGNGSLDASLLATAVSGVAISSAITNGTATVQNLAAAATVTDTLDAAGSSNLVLTHSGTGTNSLAINFAETSTTSTNVETIASLTSTGDSTISIVSGGASTNAAFGNAITAISETNNTLTSVTITGAKAFTLGGITTAVNNTTMPTAGYTASSLTKIDGSGATGHLTITAGADSGSLNNVVKYTGLVINGGTGGDTIVNHAVSGVINEGATGSTLSNTLTVDGATATINDAASAGADTINLSGFSGTATLGTGKGVVVNVIDDVAAKMSDVTNVTFGSGTANVNDNLTYHTAASGTSAATNGDTLVLNGSLHGNSVSFAAVANTAGALGAATSVAAAQTFDQAVFAAQSGTANTVTWFQYGGNTYVENSGASTATTTDNNVVKIAGVVDLSHATVAGTHVTFA